MVFRIVEYMRPFGLDTVVHATSKLLVNYPQKQRDEILDFLFKPNYGASLHILKVEIGGDAESTDGSEASHMHENGDENYQRGYEWWLMTEAKKRNPDILLYGLPWAFPGWLGNGTQNPYVDPEITADYVIRWIMGAQTFYNLKIDIVGIWNERPYNKTYIKVLRKMLDSRRLFQVRICAPDGNGVEIAEDMLRDPQLAAAVDFIGAHYPGTVSAPASLQTGKQLWASEDYSTYNDNTGAGCWARLINQNYVNGMMSSTIAWNLVAAYYQGLPHFREGLMTAVEPWGGNYRVEAPIWITAHTTQFTKPGWKYLRHGSGVGKLTAGGSYVTFTDPEVNSLTIVIETMSHDHSVCIRPPLQPYSVQPQTATFKLSGSFAQLRSLNVWFTEFAFDGSDSVLFQQNIQLIVGYFYINVTNSTITLSLGVDEMYTLTTVSTGQKGTAPNPLPSKPFPLPYKDDFEAYPAHTEPYNLAQQKGVWEVIDLGAPRGKVIRQMMAELPVYWCMHGPQHLPHTVSVIGSTNWTDIYVEVEARVGAVNGTDGVFVAARIDNGGCNVSYALGYYFVIYPSKQQYQLTHDIIRQDIIKSGPAPTNSDWNTLGLLIQNGISVGWLNGQKLFTVAIPATPESGFVGIGTTNVGIVDFDNLQIRTSQDGLKKINRVLKSNDRR
ncbi:LOW QUALITY PROTEIN: galactocerebrosidase-like [Liolophura sinensis]|uniref:LOW QUALITY PROTEIN: galactocerebrosidase-like n=1 Tax=Liolophura sinensis TaxID=3198878 RepID=UPI003158F9DA